MSKFAESIILALQPLHFNDIFEYVSKILGGTRGKSPVKIFLTYPSIVIDSAAKRYWGLIR